MAASFWKTDLKNAEAALRQSLASQIITAKHAAAYMIRNRWPVNPKLGGLEMTQEDLALRIGISQGHLSHLYGTRRKRDRAEF